MFRSGCPTRKPSQRPTSNTPLLSVSIAARAALIRSMARARSYSGLAASPVESSIDNPAIPVFTPRATVAPTSSGLCAKPPAKSAVTGRSTAPQSAARCAPTRGGMRATLVAGHAIVGLADRPRKAGAGGGDRLEADLRERPRGADVPWIWEHEAARFVHLAECGALVGGGGGHMNSLDVVGATISMRRARR